MRTINHPPGHLAELRCWLVWRYESQAGHEKPRKVPYYANGMKRSGEQGGERDRAQLVTFAEAVRACSDSFTGVGLAVLPDMGIVALDFDDCVADGTVDPAVDALCYGTYSELSPSGTGVRAFFKGTLLSKSDAGARRGAFAVEVFGHNGFVTFTGNATDTCRIFDWDSTVADLSPAVRDMYRERGWDENERRQDAPQNALALLQPTLPITDGEVAETLQKLSPDMEYHDWVRVGMAVHQQTGGQGFDIWHNWSKQGEKYRHGGEKHCRTRWKSFGRYTAGPQLTFAFVQKLAKEADARRAVDAKNELQAKIRDCHDEFALRTRLCSDIAHDARLDDLGREALAKALQSKLKGLGSEYPIAECRRMVAPPRSQRTRAVEDFPDWLRKFVFVTDQDKFFRYDSEEWLTQTGFNAKYNRHMPRSDAGRPAMTAVQAALEDYCIQTVTRAMYLPWARDHGDGTFEMYGVRHVNTYRPSSVPRAESSLSTEGRRAVQLVLQHIGLLAGGRAEVVDHIVSFFAYCVQNPGVKIRHAILIKGIEGDGKTLLGGMMSVAMGEPNVKQVSPKVLGTDFTDWAHGACLAILEEIKLTGHNRHDILNALKPMITNDVIAVHPKGKAEINVANTMNYLAFTNHSDALPLADTDRRWYVVFTPYGCREDLQQAVAQRNPAGAEAYFRELHEAIAAHPAALRRWLLDYALAPSFNPNAPAPATDEKTAMVNMSATPEEALVREIIAHGAPGVGENILSVGCLKDAALLADSTVSLETSVGNRVLMKLGWTKLPDRVKWRKSLHTVWFRGKPPARPQEGLNASLQKFADSECNFGSGFAQVLEVERAFG